MKLPLPHRNKKEKIERRSEPGVPSPAGVPEFRGAGTQKKKSESKRKFFYSKLPKRYTQLLEREAKYAAILVPTWEYTTNIMQGVAMFEALAIAIMVLFFHAPVEYVALSIVASIVALPVVPYLVLTLAAEGRRKDMEKVLPDLLILTASNIKSGLTIDKALMFAARPEFGALAYEVKRTAFRIYSGITVEKALQEMAERIKSGIFERTVSLLVEGIRSGGNVATILEENARDIQNTEALQREIAASVKMYVMFILIAAVFGAPLLYAISGYLVTTTTRMWSNMATPNIDTSVLGGGILSIKAGGGTTDITPEFFEWFSMCAVFITTFCAGFLISAIREGNLKTGIKYAPLLAGAALGLFKLASWGIVILMGIIG